MLFYVLATPHQGGIVLVEGMVVGMVVVMGMVVVLVVVVVVMMLVEGWRCGGFDVLIVVKGWW